ncbi:tyrosine-type recombinase/integrase [Burkholderia pseudomallei]|uniref:tyrosine-type recombinase/integrase n=1 Tax=Burkholderia pseudomallei TaxID=28450 RepID=UPI000F093A92|nr:site-specific integrase [Burkholderia pseudomallei]MWA31165.1 DUF4102 domain-containing protein [Burkholderia pseudomallei]VCC53936.1 integrase [Burkholderia pseudomallei]VCD11560.1 integrase [Burkholderia pseudomallei]
MAGSRQLHRLTALRVSKALEPGYYSDGGGLQLQITTSGSRSWIFRYTLRGRSREMGLGPLSTVSLAAARAKAARCRELLKDKIDPIEARDAEQRELAERLKQEQQNARVFSVAAVDYIERQKPNWKNAKHAQQWLNTLTTYVFPTIGDVHVRDVDTPMMVKILQPIWSAKRETAARVRGRIESILDSEKALGYREGENPARWRGHLDQILPKGNRRKVKHHAALAWADTPEFMRDLRASNARSARMLELLILTIVRTNEVQFAVPGEFDLQRKIWTIPGERMKMSEPQRIPLCERACELVREALATAKYGYLFPGERNGRPFSNMAMLNLLKDLGYHDITVHGFRSTFQDWAEESAEYPDVLVEKALAHATKSKTRGAYQRGDMLERRRKMMDHWARYCAGETATVVPIMQAVVRAA